MEQSTDFGNHFPYYPFFFRERLGGISCLVALGGMDFPIPFDRPLLLQFALWDRPEKHFLLMELVYPFHVDPGAGPDYCGLVSQWSYRSIRWIKSGYRGRFHLRFPLFPVRLILTRD